MKDDAGADLLDVLRAEAAQLAGEQGFEAAGTVAKRERSVIPQGYHVPG